MKKQYAATALALLILTLTACGGGGGAAAPAMGRYVEEQRALPEGIRQVLALRTDAAGTLDMLCYMTSREQPERWVELAVFHSDDAGNTWERRPAGTTRDDSICSPMITVRRRRTEKQRVAFSAWMRAERWGASPSRRRKTQTGLWCVAFGRRTMGICWWTAGGACSMWMERPARYGTP